MNSHSVKKNRKIKPLANELSTVPDAESTQTSTAIDAEPKRTSKLPPTLESILDRLGPGLGRNSEPHDEHEVTEITVRVRPTEKKTTPTSLEFDIEAVRQQDVKAVALSSLQKGYQDPKGRRSAPRYAHKFTTIIYTKSQSFRTYTVNVSLGGALLEDRLPKEFLYGALEILFIHEDAVTRQKRYLMFKGEGLEGPGEQSRVQFHSAAQEVQDALTAVLAALGPKAITQGS